MNVDMFLYKKKMVKSNIIHTQIIYRKTIFQRKMFINPRRRKTNQKD